MVKFNDTVIICLCFFCARVWCWTCYSDNCYQRSTEKMSWSTGVSYCSYSGSIMASLHSHSENEYVRNSVCKGQECWIGLTDKYKEGKFSWVDGTPVNYQNWNSGEPNNGDGRGEDVVLMRPDGKWNDGKDYDLLYIACMKPRPTPSPTREPSYPWPTCQPTTLVPTQPPSPYPTTTGPTMMPTLQPTYRPSVLPSSEPTQSPSDLPSLEPTYSPSVLPTFGPTHPPSHSPTIVPSSGPTTVPSIDPTPYPSVLPTFGPTHPPSHSPTIVPSRGPTTVPSIDPTPYPSVVPTSGPTHPPSHPPTIVPSIRPTPVPSIDPTYRSVSPSSSPTWFPSEPPSLQPTALPSVSPTNSPSVAPTPLPSTQPTTHAPTIYPIKSPTSSTRAAATHPNPQYCIERVKLHFASIVLAGCFAICTLCIILLRRSTRNVVLSPMIFSPKTFSPKRFRIERSRVQSKPEDIPTISMKDLAFESVSNVGLEGITECEVGETVMTPV